MVITLIFIALSSTLIAQKKQNKPYKSFEEVKRLVSVKQREQALKDGLLLIIDLEMPLT
jgi:hypothetical protein